MSALSSFGLRTALGFAGMLAALGSSACTSRYEMDAAYPGEDEDSQYASYPGTSQATPVAAPNGATDANGAIDPSATEAAAIDPNDAEETDPAALSTFKPALSPYGSWYDDATYGTVWVPNSDEVGANFSPYLTGGHWAYTDEGYYWASDYSWGWAPFHYGRWMWTDGYGWAWIPGARYAPAWVDWRYGGGYVGWGPMYPSWYWRNGVVVYTSAAPTPYVFCPGNQLFSRQPSLIVAGKGASPGLVAGTKPYTPPSRTPGAARPFVGPDPKAAGVPDNAMKAATIPVPAQSRPDRIAWQPAASSKLAPVRPVAGANAPRVASPNSPGAYSRPASPVGRPTYAPPPTVRPANPVYTGRPTTPAPLPKPTYTRPPAYTPPTYSRPPTTYSPPPTYSRPPTTYSPPPTYSRPPTTYSPPPTYSRPPTYSPPTTYSRPPTTFGGGGGGGSARPVPKPSTGGGGGGGGRRR
jgi:hypothetical protein